ncbi:Cyclin-A3-1 [Dendrobium catenatum]|uniref:Cyclin-A3-1 n=1 Tax=Dendrobium catenatum TaxID=906689 RepID=A0A2I0V7S1_9ASPA|nr:Cyclin-A3-1 [Dendrobium catenatum]
MVLGEMQAEQKRRPMGNYMEKVQKNNISANMRGILVDWLVEVAEEYKLVPDTLYLAVSYVDRFLSCYTVDKQKLQLLGISSLLIASKYEEIEPPNVEDFCDITDNTYTKKEVVEMEANILKFLNFEMGNPTVKSFLRNFIKAGAEDKKVT